MVFVLSGNKHNPNSIPPSPSCEPRERRRSTFRGKLPNGAGGGNGGATSGGEIMLRCRVAENLVEIHTLLVEFFCSRHVHDQLPATRQALHHVHKATVVGI